VKNVNPECPMEELRAFFGGPGCVDRVFLPTLRGTHVPLGTAIVYYRDRQSAEEFLRATDGVIFHGRRIHVEWCLPQEVLRPPKRQQQLQMQMQLQMQLHMQQLQQATATAAAAAATGGQPVPQAPVVQHDAIAKGGFRFNPFVSAQLAAAAAAAAAPPPPPPQSHLGPYGGLHGVQHSGGGRSVNMFMQPMQQRHRPSIGMGAMIVQQQQQQQQQIVQQRQQQVVQQQQQQQQQRQRQLEAAALYNQYAAAAAAYGFLPIGTQTDPAAAAAAVVAGMQAAAAAAASGNQTAVRRGMLFRRSQQPYQ